MSDATPRTRPRDAPGGTFDLGSHTVARVGYGAMGLERLTDDRDGAVRLLRRAADLGVDHVDTADFYGAGAANDAVRQAFGTSDAVTVVSKVGIVGIDAKPGLALAQRPEQLRAQVHENLRSLGRDRIDVVNLRRADLGPGLRATKDQVVDVDDQLAVMTALRDEGLIGGIGLSAVSAEVVDRAAPAGIVCVQNAYSLVDRGGEELLAACGAAGIAWVPFFPLGGRFPGQTRVVDTPVVDAVAAELGVSAVQVGLAWLLQHAPHVLLIPGTSTVAHLEENVAVDDVELSAVHVAALDRVAG